MTLSEQYYNNAKEAQAKWTQAVKSVFDEAKRAFDGETLRVDAAASGERVQQGIDQVFDFWTKAIEFNRDLTKKVAEANLEYLNVLKSQAEAAGEQYLAKFEEARGRAEKVARETQDALAKSAVELETSAKKVGERATEQFEKNVSAASDQTAKLSQKAAERTEKNVSAASDQTAKQSERNAEQAEKNLSDESEKTASRTRSTKA